MGVCICFFCDKAVIGAVYRIERYLGKIVRYIIFRKPGSLRNSECYENNLYKNNLLLYVTRSVTDLLHSLEE